MSKPAGDEIRGRRALAFVKTTLVGGLVFLVPAVLLWLVVGKAVALLRRLAQPLAAQLPRDSLLGALAADAMVVVLVILGCFLAGLLARVSLANRVVKKAEAGVLWRIPGYALVKALTESLDQRLPASSMHPVLIHFDDAAQLAFEVDRLTDGRRVIYLPSAPDPRAGSVLIMDQDRVEPVPISCAAAIGALSGLGRGIGASLSVLR
jgi:uncharacterized membrane protein